MHAPAVVVWVAECGVAGMEAVEEQEGVLYSD